jgi:hypothetical protein
MGVTNYNASALAAAAVMGLSLNTTTTGAGGIGVLGSANNESGNAVEGQLFYAGGYAGWGGYFNADVYCGGTYFGSDRRLKRDIQPLTGALDIINRIDPVTYYYDTEKYPEIGFDENRLSYGFIAQDIEQVVPEMVKDKNLVLNSNTLKTLDTDYKRETELFKVVNYSLMIPILTQAIKEQQNLINEIGTSKKIMDFGSEELLEGTEMWVSYNEDFTGNIPVITVTTNNPNVVLSIVEKTGTKFKVKASTQVNNLNFDWIALAKN